MRDCRARGVQRSRDVERVQSLPGLWVAVCNRLKGKAAGDVDQRIELAEMRGRLVDRLLGLGRIGQIDAAEFNPLGRRGRLRACVIDAGDAGALRQRFLGDHLAERARRAGDDDDFSVHKEGLRKRTEKEAHNMVRRNSFAMLPISRRNAIQLQIVTAKRGARMVDDLALADLPDEVIGFKYPLPCLARAIRDGGPIKIVAIGSSSTAGRADVVPYPHWLEMYLRVATDNWRIDVINRGKGGEEADKEFARFDSDVFAEEPSLVIWQVGTN